MGAGLRLSVDLAIASRRPDDPGDEPPTQAREGEWREDKVELGSFSGTGRNAYATMAPRVAEASSL
jgi:hypothetical protein